MNLTNLVKHSFLLALLALLCWSSCRKDDTFITDGNAKLAFSTDTLRFDTVFTTQGSAVRYFKVYNRHSQPIKIDNIQIGSSASSKFRLNVDGTPTNTTLENIEIAAKDSLYVFASVTINPDEPLSVSPFIVQDSITFRTNGNLQTVKLEAFGQNANYVTPRSGAGQILQICSNGELVWDDAKPYILYGAAYVGAGCTLRIVEGTRVYVHGGLAKDDNGNIYNDGVLIVDERGKLVINGSKERPVVIQGDRLEAAFADTRGQWAGILLAQGSKNNVVSYATIKNSIVGIRVDSAASLTIQHSKILNTAGSGLLGVHARIVAHNCLIANNSLHSLQAEYGGVYDFTYCTLANIGTDKSALRLTNVICDAPLCAENRTYPLNATFKNCILYGSQPDAMELVNYATQPSFFQYNFSHCIFREDELAEGEFANFYENCNNCLNTNTLAVRTLFKNSEESDFRLDTLSIAEGKALPVPTISIDLENNARDAATPDIGCYEYQY